MASTSGTERGLNLLSFDGGGIRGLSALLILREIMERIRFLEKLQKVPLPSEYFDLIGGTSTGGIIAIMLGRLGMSVEDAIDAYLTMASRVFSETKTFRDGKFKATNLENAIREIVKERNGDSEAMMITPDPNAPKCFVCAVTAANMRAGIPHLLRTYPGSTAVLPDCKIVRAVRATTAAPTFFKKAFLDDLERGAEYIDGGMGCNNPIDAVLKEAAEVFPGHKVASIVSIGTGNSGTISLPRSTFFRRALPLDVIEVLRRIATDCEQKADETEARFENMPNIYFRFNVDQGLQNVGLGDWEKMGDVDGMTQAYIRSAGVRASLGRAVEALRERKGIVSVHQISGKVRSLPVKKSGSMPCPPPTRLFTGRDEVLSKMNDYVLDGSDAMHIFILHGLGGAGKSQTTFEFVKMNSAQLSELFFIDASSRETIIVGLSNIARDRDIGDSYTDGLTWLAGQRSNWLLIFDGADDTNLNLREFFPNCTHGNIIITTRNHETIRHAHPEGAYCELSGLLIEDARRLLLRTSCLPDETTTEGHSYLLCQELGCLALAVTQAGRFIQKHGWRISDYLETYKTRHQELLEKSAADIQKTDEYKYSVYTTWIISYERLGRLSQTFLHLCAFLHHGGISETIFQSAAAEIDEFVPVIPFNDPETASFDAAKAFLFTFRMDDGQWDSLRFSDIVTEIRSVSLIQYDTLNRLYNIHPLVHDWSKTTIEDMKACHLSTQSILSACIRHSADVTSDKFRRSLISHVNEVLKEPGSCTVSDFSTEWALVQRDAGQWERAAELGKEVMEKTKGALGEEHPKTISSMANLAITYWNQGRWKEAEELEVTVLEKKMRVLGEEHPDTLTSMANLAATYWDQGRWKEAEELQVTVLETRKLVLGEDHPDTLSSMGNLAATYGKQGRWKEAEELQVTVLETTKRVLGEEHPDTLSCMANLASTYRKQGRWKEAEELEVTVLETRKRLLGEDHPKTLKCMGNLANTYWKQGRWKEAEELQVTVLETLKQLLGEDHPDTLTSMANLASTYRKQGRWKEAEELQVTVLEMSKRVLGDENPDTLTSMANLAATYWNQGRWKEAEELQVTVLETMKRVFGEDHPDTLSSMANLASTYWKQGRWKEAEELQVTVLETMKRVLGDVHPETLSSMGNLANTYWNQGRWKEAEELQVTVLETLKQLLGEDHPDTLTSMGNLAITYWNQGRWKEAEELQVTVLEISKRVLGEDHPGTLTSMANLATTYRNQGRWKEAEELEVTVLAMRKHVLGEDHPDTLISMGNLANTYCNQGRWKKAEELHVTVLEISKRVLGEDHPDTIRYMANLAHIYWEQHRLGEAEKLEEFVLGLSKRVLGEEHPGTLTRMHNLSVTYRDRGRIEEAERLDAVVRETRARLGGGKDV